MFNKKWFLNNQKLLKWFANTRYGRDLLGHDLDKVDLILPNAVVKKNLTTYTAEFRTHNKYAKRLFYEFQPIWKAFHWFDMNVANVYIPKLNLGFDTFYPDANVESTSVDGRVDRSGVDQTFSNIRGGAGVAAQDSTASDNIVKIAASSTSSQYANLTRGIFLFDTSSLPDNATVSSATASFYRTASNDTLTAGASANSTWELVSSTPASNTAIVAADYSQTGGTSFGSSAIYNSRSNSVYNDITINASGIATISLTGITKFAVKFKWDLDNTTTGITWSSGGEIRDVIDYADTAGTTTDPKLVVTYTTGQAGYFHFM